jgi:hypothetical protein
VLRSAVANAYDAFPILSRVLFDEGSKHVTQVCEYIYIYIYIYIYMYIYKHTHMHAYYVFSTIARMLLDDDAINPGIYTYICTHTTHAHTHIYIHTHAETEQHSRPHIHVYIYIDIHTRTCGE